MARTRLRLFKIVCASLWLALFLAALAFWVRSGVALTAIPALLETWLREFGLLRAAAIYVVLYALRPLLLFPATLLTVASGLLFGPWLGALFTIVGENASANLAFALARWFGRRAVAAHASGAFQRWDARLERNAIAAVLSMRLLMLPFDAVNYGCGLTAMRQRDYALGTFFGILPALVGFVLLGGMAAPRIHHRFLTLLLAIICMVCGFGLAHYLRRREGNSYAAENPQKPRATPWAARRDSTP